MTTLGNPLLLSPEGYQIERSVRLRSSASAYFNRTPASAGNRKTFTWSAWVKRGSLGAVRDIFTSGSASGPYSYMRFGFASDDCLEFIGYDDSAGLQWYLKTTQVLRDPSAWYHIAVLLDTTNGTSSNRAKIYVNGVEVSSFKTGSFSTTYPSLNLDSWVNTNSYPANIGRFVNASNYFDGYLTEINFIDGQALTPSSFGETDAVTGVWKPKKYAGTYGTNGFYLNFSDPSAATAAAIGKDYSGNGNNWTPNNISVTAGATYDSMIDTPTMWADGGNGRGNYCTLNPLSFYSSGTISLTNGNLTVSDGTSAFGYYRGTMACAHKSYHEVELTTIGTGVNGINIGLCTDTSNPSTGAGIVQYDADGRIYLNGSLNTTVATLANGDVIGITYDPSTGSAAFYKNNFLQATISTGFTASSVLPMVGGGSSVNAQTLNANFGQRPFAYTPPTGFKALNTQNLPEPTIKRGNQWFDATTYTGNGTTQSIVNSGGMQPDLVWVKVRSAAYDNRLFDSSRPLNAWLSSNLTSAEINSTLNDNFLSYNSNGFSVGPTSATNGLNQSGQTFVGWQWKANGAGVSNTDGSITSTVSAGVTQGFSVVTYTGTGSAATVGHGLGVAPKMMIVKRRNSTGEWLTYTQMTGNTNFLELNTTAASFASSTAWNNTSPTSSVFSVGTASAVNASGGTYVAYCFAEVPGFSRFGSYTGNGSTDGPFQYLGFAPAFIMLKRTDSTGNWSMYDRARSPKNADTKVLYPNLSNAEDASTDHFDWLSNGFKMKSTNQNTNGGTFIYMAFAESPFKNSLAR